MTITKDSAKLYKFLKDESQRDVMSLLENTICRQIRRCYRRTENGIYSDLSVVQDYFRIVKPSFANECRKFDDL